MRLHLDVRSDYVRAQLYGRETPEENRAAAHAIVEALKVQGLKNLLIEVRESRAIFKVEGYGLSKIFDALADMPD